MAQPLPPRTDHWRRFRRLMLLMVGVAAAAVAAALLWLHRHGTPMPWPAVIAVTLGIGLSLLLAGALMGLVFVSARSGHDDTVDDLPRE